MFYAFGTRFQSFWSRFVLPKKLLARDEQNHDFHFFFFSMFLCMSAQVFGEVLLALILGGTSKSRVSKEKYSSVFSIRTPTKDAGFV